LSDIFNGVPSIPTGCELTLTQEGVLPEWFDRTREGWGKIVGGLSANLAKEAAYGVGVEPGTIRFERLVPGPIERVWAYLIESDKRSKWLAFGEMEHRVGGMFELRFEHAKLSSRQASDIKTSQKSPSPGRWGFRTSS
jgi:Activator of Hsp90 ATPase homolog 1-like protein